MVKFKFLTIIRNRIFACAPQLLLENLLLIHNEQLLLRQQIQLCQPTQELDKIAQLTDFTFRKLDLLQFQVQFTRCKLYGKMLVRYFKRSISIVYEHCWHLMLFSRPKVLIRARSNPCLLDLRWDHLKLSLQFQVRRLS